jgi:hypothetical protein
MRPIYTTLAFTDAFELEFEVMSHPLSYRIRDTWPVLARLDMPDIDVNSLPRLGIGQLTHVRVMQFLANLCLNLAFDLVFETGMMFPVRSTEHNDRQRRPPAYWPGIPPPIPMPPPMP